MDGFGLEAEARMTTWHIMIPSDIEPDGGYSQDISEGNCLNFPPTPFSPLISDKLINQKCINTSFVTQTLLTRDVSVFTYITNHWPQALVSAKIPRSIMC